MTTYETTELVAPRENAGRRAGGQRFSLGMALLSAAAFGGAGAGAKSLLDAGWSPAAAVTGRILIGAIALAIPTVWAMRGRWHLVSRNFLSLLIYGVLGVAVCQFAYFEAVQTLSVGVALLLEYSSPLLLVFVLWAWHRRTPPTLTLVGAGVCVGGLLLVLDVFGGAHLSLIGVLWGLTAAVGSASYFLTASRSHGESGEGLPPIALAGLGLGVGALFMLLLDLLRVVPSNFTTNSAVLAGHTVPWWLPLIALGVIATAVSYGAGVIAVRGLGTTIASFVSLCEVLAAIVVAWLLLGQVPMPIQMAGGALVVLGVILVRIGELRRVSAA